MVQDATGATFVIPDQVYDLTSGDRVEVVGVITCDDYAHAVRASSIRSRGAMA